MNCRLGCGACCIAPSISSPIPGMPDGKPSGVRCVQLGQDNECLIFGQLARPVVCASLKPHKEMCGENDGETGRKHALVWLTRLEESTRGC
jgi:uncharacterized protein